MPLDSTQLKLDEVKRESIFPPSTPLTDALTLLYPQWGQQTPTLYDPVAVAFAIAPQICSTQPFRIEIDDKGYTRPIALSSAIPAQLLAAPLTFQASLGHVP
jgi:purine nucleosidase